MSHFVPHPRNSVGIISREGGSGRNAISRIEYQHSTMPGSQQPDGVAIVAPIEADRLRVHRILYRGNVRIASSPPSARLRNTSSPP
jgi:hypothetical protein